VAQSFCDSSNVAQSFLGIVMHYIFDFHSEEAYKRWFHSSTYENMKKLELNYTLEGDWEGTWKTQSDKEMTKIYDEDMGFNFNLENLDLVKANDAKK
jgi:hypothetical protein